MLHSTSAQDVILASFGDMLRVPGSRGSLLDTKAIGGQVKTVYSPLDAIELAKRHPNKEVVFFSVGFETTAPATALAVKQAASEGVENFSLLVAHVRVQPAMEALLESTENRVQAFLAAGHVCAVMGYASYESIVQRYQLPIVVTGFEPVDLLEGILCAVRQLEQNEARVENAYSRSVIRDGNQAAQDIVSEVYEIGDRQWRGFGVVTDGGLRLRNEWRQFDANAKIQFDREFTRNRTHRMSKRRCVGGAHQTAAMRGIRQAVYTGCTYGAPMVSTEGACAAYFKWHKHE